MWQHISPVKSATGVAAPLERKADDRTLGAIGFVLNEFVETTNRFAL
jgi:hypothetical protein